MKVPRVTLMSHNLNIQQILPFSYFKKVFTKNELLTKCVIKNLILPYANYLHNHITDSNCKRNVTEGFHQNLGVTDNGRVYK